MPQYMEMPTDRIQVSRFNPERRVDRNRLTGLMLSIREHGILSPLVLAADYVLADGHRRLACAKLLHMPTVPTAHYTESKLAAPALWVTLNAETSNLTPAQWLDAVAHGLPLETAGFPETLKRRIVRLQELIGKDAIMELVEMGRSPNILDSAERIARYCGRRDDAEFLRLAVLWMTDTGNSFAVKAAMDEEIPDDLLVEAIEAGHPLMRVWDVAR